MAYFVTSYKKLTCLVLSYILTLNSLHIYGQTPTIISASFDAIQKFTTDQNPNGVVMADFDGDGKPDLATPNFYSIAGSPASVSVLRNTGIKGAIAFAPPLNLPTSAFTYALAAGDINGDGKPDLVATNIQDNTISIFINQSTAGNIVFAPKIDYATGTNPVRIAIHDLDGDGRADIMVANALSQTISIFRNTTTGGTVSFAARTDFGTALYPQAIAVGDMDGDGKPDIVVANSFSYSVSLLRNTSTSGTIAFAAHADLPTSTVRDEPYGIALADLDGDGRLDMIVSNFNFNLATDAKTTMSVFKNSSSTGSFSFTAPQNYAAGNGNHPAVADLNGDGKPEILLPYMGVYLLIFQNSSTSGTISLGAPVSLLLNNSHDVVAGDLDGDGLPDIAATNSTSTNVAVVRNKIYEPVITYFYNFIASAGDTIGISGANFTNATAVAFGGVPAASFAVVSDKSITAVVGPAGATGSVSVTTPKGTAAATGFIFKGPPVITSFTPATAGYGKTVTINGHNFNDATAVSFGVAPATSFQVISPDLITAVVDTGASGSISITTQYGTGTSPGFTFVPSPVISSFTPTSAGTGATITITGRFFTGATAVSFGGVPAGSFTIVNASTIQATVGAGDSGNVSVTNPYGTMTSPGFTWYPPPVLASFSPATGIDGTVLTLTGSHFDNITSVTVGGVNYSYNIVSSQQITLTLGPNGASGDIVITTAGGSATLPGFIFYKRPSFYGISPNPAGAGMQVTITGINFSGISSVKLGSVAVRSFTVNSSTSITAIVGAGATGTVEITNPAGSTGNSNSTPDFTFVQSPLISSYTPTSGPIGTVVTLSGGNFNMNDVVYFGGAMTHPLSVTDSTMTVAVPSGASSAPVAVTAPSLYMTGYADQPFSVTFPVDPAAFNDSSFAGHMDFLTGVLPTDVATGDIDGDGKLDIAVANYDGGTVSIYRNTSIPGQLSFAPRKDIAVGVGVKNISLTDMDGDGKLDIVTSKGNDGVCGGCTGGGIVILPNHSIPGQLIFGQSSVTSTYEHLDFMVVGDLDGDGRPEIAGIDGRYCLACLGAPAYLTIFKNTSTSGSISLEEFHYGIDPGSDAITGYSPVASGLALRDLNGDGKPEIIMGEAGSNFEVIFTNKSVYNFPFVGTNILYPYYTVSQANYPVAADFDGDGYPDFVTTSTIHKNKGNFSFDNQGLASSGGSSVAADFNGDGLPDIARTGLANDSVIYLYKDSSTSSSIAFGKEVRYPVLSSLNKRIMAADLDGDGKPEIIITNKTKNSFSILRNRTGEPAPPAPAIASFTPASGNFAITITITGSNFTQTTSVTIGGTPVSSFQVISPDTITAITDTGSTGEITVATPGGTATAGPFTFIPIPTPKITAISPATATAGTTITLTGINLDGVTAVTFGSAAARSFTVVSPTTITAIVDTATTDFITVTSPTGVTSFFGFTFIPTPSIIADGDTSICIGSHVTLNSSAGDNDQWYQNNIPIPNATDQTLLVDSAGFYTVTTTINGVTSAPSAGKEVITSARQAKPTITLIGDKLVSSDSTDNQWYYPDTLTAIQGQMGTTYRPTQSGNYYLRRIHQGCASPFSTAYAFVWTAIGSVSLPGNEVRFTPNPAKDFIVVNFDFFPAGGLTVELFDLKGRNLITRTNVHDGDQVNISGLTQGVYFIKAIIPGKGTGTVGRIIKL